MVSLYSFLKRSVCGVEGIDNFGSRSQTLFVYSILLGHGLGFSGSWF